MEITITSGAMALKGLRGEIAGIHCRMAVIKK
jgi:hypothetical protein